MGEWEPLIEQVRPHATCRRTFGGRSRRSSGDTRMAPSGAPSPGTWALVDGGADLIRWAQLGVWERLLDLVQGRGVALGMTFLDGTNVRAHHKAAGAKKGGRQAAARCARGAWPLSWRLWHQSLRDRGRARASDCLRACARVRRMNCRWAGAAGRSAGRARLGGRGPGLASNAFREPIWNIGARPAIPPRRPTRPRLPGVDLQQPPPRREPLGTAERMARGRHTLRKDRPLIPRRALPRRYRRLAQVIEALNRP